MMNAQHRQSTSNELEERLKVGTEENVSETNSFINVLSFICCNRIMFLAICNRLRLCSWLMNYHYVTLLIFKLYYVTS